MYPTMNHAHIRACALARANDLVHSRPCIQVVLEAVLAQAQAPCEEPCGPQRQGRARGASYNAAVAGQHQWLGDSRAPATPSGVAPSRPSSSGPPVREELGRSSSLRSPRRQCSSSNSRGQRLLQPQPALRPTSSFPGPGTRRRSWSGRLWASTSRPGVGGARFPMAPVRRRRIGMVRQAVPRVEENGVSGKAPASYTRRSARCENVQRRLESHGCRQEALALSHPCPKGIQVCMSGSMWAGICAPPHACCTSSTSKAPARAHVHGHSCAHTSVPSCAHAEMRFTCTCSQVSADVKRQMS